MLQKQILFYLFIFIYLFFLFYFIYLFFFILSFISIIDAYQGKRVLMPYENSEDRVFIFYLNNSLYIILIEGASVS